MHIDPRSTIAGLPALRVRSFLRRAGDYDWTEAGLAEHFGVSPKAAHELLSLGYLEHSPHEAAEEQRYRRTLAGAALALASAARPITRKTADRKIAELLDRVREVNANDYYLYRVRKVVVFGSYLTQRSRINDIDVGLDLAHREADPERRSLLDRDRINAAYKAGRRFPNITSELFWPQHEVLLYLKARSRSLSLHTTDDGILENTETKILFDVAGKDK